MRFRSAGLGPTELKGRIAGLAPVGEDLLVLHIHTHSPVEWNLKAAMQRKDIPKVIRGMLKPAIFFHMVRTMFYLKKNPKELEDIMDKSIST
ncbi:MAG: hypothetical protein A2Z29_10360 [Chloroflexi bacterium RBG_16_56_11]|nr:MAG: hypothetical protein A2Z29_10360 [Chloroflexi bacterium RBG_16_56_11]HJX13954.1 hypothetical protein [Dehalococcoidales bacterium]